jgi:peptide-methionine (S)-S-oxide reductase
MFFGLGKSTDLLPATDTLLGRAQALGITNRHAVNGNPLQPPFLPHLERAVFALGCFWGAERIFWRDANVFTTAVGYAGGQTPNPTYEEVCSGRTNHTEVVLVVVDPQQTSYAALLKLFWESHNPTQGMRQGNDRGTQYRSAIYTYGQAQLDAALQSKAVYDAALKARNFDAITTEMAPAGEFYYAEEYHQQYLHKNPAGYCGIGGTGVRCEVGA